MPECQTAFGENKPAKKKKKKEVKKKKKKDISEREGGVFSFPPASSLMWRHKSPEYRLQIQTWTLCGEKFLCSKEHNRRGEKSKGWGAL